MATAIVNNQEIDLPDGERLNGIEAARLAGIDIPHYCWHPGLSVVASCRMCLVETGKRDAETGKVSMLPKLVPACQTPAGDGTVFVTDSEKVKAARAMVEEDLLINHPIDCPICDKAGECLLQDYYFEHGQGSRRADIQPFSSRRRDVGDTVTLFVDRCVMCSRCVRFTREVTGTNELMVINRGAGEEIDVFPGYPLDNKMAGNVVDLCPVGALGDKDFLYQQRVWFMKRHEGICGRCSTGCSIYLEENQDRLYRIKPRENLHVNQWWICDEGRYGYHHVHSEQRLTTAEKREDDQWSALESSQLFTDLDADLKKAGRLAAVLSPHLTVEEAWLLAQYVRSIDEQAVLAVGHAPVEGEDESFPAGFTIHAEKCPNRRGVEQIVTRCSGGLIEWKDLPEKLAEEEVRGLWVTGGYIEPWIDEQTAAALREVDLLVASDLFSTPLTDAADYRLPAAAFAERAGSYVNFAARLQSFTWAIRPPAGVLSEGQLLWRLLGRERMYDPGAVREEVAREIAYFSAAAGEIPADGVDLKINQLAAT